MTWLITLSNMAQLLLRGEGSSWQASTDRGVTWVDVAAEGHRVHVARLAALALGLPGDVTVVAPQPEQPVLDFPFGPGTETQ